MRIRLKMPDPFIFFALYEIYVENGIFLKIVI